MMRCAGLLIVSVAACAHARPATEPPRPIEVPEVPEGELGVPPASAPRGAPVAITIVPLKVGEARTRRFSSHFEIHDRAHGGKPRQVTDKSIVLREELVTIDGDALVYRTTVDEATENMTLADAPHAQTLLHGVYVVGVFSPGGEHAAGAAREDHASLGDRELEEIDEQYGMDAGRPTPIAQIVAHHPLRAGESVALSEAERLIYNHGETIDSPIALTVLATTDTTVTYQLDAIANVPPVERRVRMKFELQRATGRVVLVDAHQRDVEADEIRDLTQTTRFAVPAS